MSLERWASAQSAERAFWAGVDMATVAATVASQAIAAEWITGHVQDPPPGPWLEVGIGPLALGCLQLCRGDRDLIGVEPLELVGPDDLPRPLAAMLEACRTNGYRHVRRPGEDTGLNGGAFGLVACHNVLDHTRDPAAVLRELRRVVAADGVAFIGCDIRSTVGTYRMRYITRRRRPDSFLVRAHPYEFRATELLRLISSAGFRVRAENASTRSVLDRHFGHASMAYVLAEPV